MSNYNNMLLITSTWGESRANTFKLIPTDLNCPYQECIYDPEAGVLAIISKTSLQKWVMMPKLNDFGDLEMVKNNPRPGGKRFKEERRSMETYQEYYIEVESEITDFIARFASNSGTFNYTQFYKKPAPPGEITMAGDPAVVKEQPEKVAE